MQGVRLVPLITFDRGQDKENAAIHDIIHRRAMRQTDVDKCHDKYAHGAPGQSPEIDLSPINLTLFHNNNLIAIFSQFLNVQS